MTEDYGVIAQLRPNATTLTTLYTVPSGKRAIISSIVAANHAASQRTYRLSVAVAGAADDPKQYLAYDVPLDGNTSDPWQIGITLNETDVIRVYVSAADISFNVFGAVITP